MSGPTTSYYVHNGYFYGRDPWTGITTNYGPVGYAKIPASETTYVRDPEAEKKARARSEAALKAAAPRKAKRAALVEKAKALALTLGDVTPADIEQWRIDNGYLQRVYRSKYSYTLPIKRVTASNEEDFVIYNAMRYACFAKYGTYGS